MRLNQSIFPLLSSPPPLPIPFLLLLFPLPCLLLLLPPLSLMVVVRGVGLCSHGVYWIQRDPVVIKPSLGGRKGKKGKKKVRISGIINWKNITGELNGVTPKGGRLMPTLRPTRMANHPSLPFIT